ncbi:MAG: TetR/AcrR family transcriptional regulator [Bryobacteraceae bacterium]|nr:TetR/AcrR family transcriptional regulator [Bryobacteraceae bacterium]
MPQAVRAKALSAENAPDAAGVRRKPVQGRSTETVQQVLAAASALLGRMPLEDITTSLVAKEAGISVGGLYRFFPDKQSIIDAIAVRHMEDFKSALLRSVAKLALADGPTFLSRVIDAYVAFLDERPDFRTIALGRHVSAQARKSQAEPDAGPAALVRWFLMKRLGVKKSGDLDLKLRVLIETGERLIAYAYTQDSVSERQRVLAEMKLMLANYLFG